jgi:hypothetical protein
MLRFRFSGVEAGKGSDRDSCGCEIRPRYELFGERTLIIKIQDGI